MAKQRSERLRAHPRERFAERQQEFTLEAVAAKLRKEPQAGEAGHRQETLYRRGPMSVSMLVFDRLTPFGAPPSQWRRADLGRERPAPGDGRRWRPASSTRAGCSSWRQASNTMWSRSRRVKCC